MKYRIETPCALQDRAEVHDIIHEFYSFQTHRLHQSGGPVVSPDVPVAGFWDAVAGYFPPKGALTLARAEAGHLIGCGAISDIGNGIAELKYLYVRPEARRLGLGRALVLARIAIARDMGLSQIRVDTLKASVEMQALYESMGFRKTPVFANSKSLKDVSGLAEFLYFYRKDQ